MLVLTRHPSDRPDARNDGTDTVVIRVPGYRDITVTVVCGSCERVRLSIDAPREVEIDRMEVRIDKDRTALTRTRTGG
jgi:sRNA-binding carbon storage regulator CsrA